MAFHTVFFDLDSTLYPDSNGLWKAIRGRIEHFMQERMNFPPEDIPQLTASYLETYGTTLRGLQIHHQVDPLEYLSYVHDLPLEEYLSPDPVLREMLLSIPSRRWVFTNSDAPHAKNVLRQLGIEDCFEGLIDVLVLDPACKPRLEAYHRALKLAGGPDPRRCAMVDDLARNLTPAQELNMFTVLVGPNGHHNAADRWVRTIHDLPSAVPEFWD